MTPFQLTALTLPDRGVTTDDLNRDNRRPNGSAADLFMLANAARRG